MEFRAHPQNHYKLLAEVYYTGAGRQAGVLVFLYSGNDEAGSFISLTRVLMGLG